MGLLNNIFAFTLLIGITFTSFTVNANEDVIGFEVALNDYLEAEQFEQTWNDMLTQQALESFTKAMQNDPAKLDATREIFEKHLQFSLIQNDLKTHLMNHMTASDLEFLTKKSLKMLPDNEANNQKFKELMQIFQTCVSLTLKTKFDELMQSGIFTA